MRLDKLLAHRGYGSRKEVKEFIRKGYVSVNGTIVFDDDTKINEKEDEVYFLEENVPYEEKVYFWFYKPKGYVCANFDPTEPTIFEFFRKIPTKNLFSVGRLDKDTTGLLLITNDGILSHRLLSKKSAVPKTYEVTFTGTVRDESLFSQGMTLEDGSVCLPACFTLLSSGVAHLTIYEGKYHQVKRMMAMQGCSVTSLKRISFAGISLPRELSEGEYRTLTSEEIRFLKAI